MTNEEYAEKLEKKDSSKYSFLGSKLTNSALALALLSVGFICFAETTPDEVSTTSFVANQPTSAAEVKAIADALNAVLSKIQVKQGESEEESQETIQINAAEVLVNAPLKTGTFFASSDLSALPGGALSGGDYVFSDAVIIRDPNEQSAQGIDDITTVMSIGNMDNGSSIEATGDITTLGKITIGNLNTAYKSITIEAEDESVSGNNGAMNFMSRTIPGSGTADYAFHFKTNVGADDNKAIANVLIDGDLQVQGSIDTTALIVNGQQISRICSCIGQGGVAGVTLWGPEGENCGGFGGINGWGLYDQACRY